MYFDSDVLDWKVLVESWLSTRRSNEVQVSSIVFGLVRCLGFRTG